MRRRCSTAISSRSARVICTGRVVRAPQLPRPRHGKAARPSDRFVTIAGPFRGPAVYCAPSQLTVSNALRCLLANRLRHPVAPPGGWAGSQPPPGSSQTLEPFDAPDVQARRIAEYAIEDITIASEAPRTAI